MDRFDEILQIFKTQQAEIESLSSKVNKLEKANSFLLNAVENSDNLPPIYDPDILSIDKSAAVEKEASLLKDVLKYKDCTIGDDTTVNDSFDDSLMLEVENNEHELSNDQIMNSNLIENVNTHVFSNPHYQNHSYDRSYNSGVSDKDNGNDRLFQTVISGQIVNSDNTKAIKTGTNNYNVTNPRSVVLSRSNSYPSVKLTENVNETTVVEESDELFQAFDSVIETINNNTDKLAHNDLKTIKRIKMNLQRRRKSKETLKCLDNLIKNLSFKCQSSENHNELSQLKLTLTTEQLKSDILHNSLEDSTLHFLDKTTDLLKKNYNNNDCLSSLSDSCDDRKKSEILLQTVSSKYNPNNCTSTLRFDNTNSKTKNDFLCGVTDNSAKENSRISLQTIRSQFTANNCTSTIQFENMNNSGQEGCGSTSQSISHQDTLKNRYSQNTGSLITSDSNLISKNKQVYKSNSSVEKQIQKRKELGRINHSLCKYSIEMLDEKTVRGFVKFTALVKGYIVRTLLQTTQVRNVIITVKDTAQMVLNIRQERQSGDSALPEEMNGRQPRPETFSIRRTQQESLMFQQRLVAQLSASLRQLHEIFFDWSSEERMDLIRRHIDKLIELATLHLKSETSPMNESHRMLNDTTASKDLSTIASTSNSKTPFVSSATIKRRQNKALREQEGNFNRKISAKSASASTNPTNSHTTGFPNSNTTFRSDVTSNNANTQPQSVSTTPRDPPAINQSKHTTNNNRFVSTTLKSASTNTNRRLTKTNVPTNISNNEPTTTTNNQSTTTVTTLRTEQSNNTTTQQPPSTITTYKQRCSELSRSRSLLRTNDKGMLHKKSQNSQQSGKSTKPETPGNKPVFNGEINFKNADRSATPKGNQSEQSNSIQSAWNSQKTSPPSYTSSDTATFNRPISSFTFNKSIYSEQSSIQTHETFQKQHKPIFPPGYKQSSFEESVSKTVSKFVKSQVPKHEPDLRATFTKEHQLHKQLLSNQYEVPDISQGDVDQYNYDEKRRTRTFIIPVDDHDKCQYLKSPSANNTYIDTDKCYTNPYSYTNSLCTYDLNIDDFDYSSLRQYNYNNSNNNNHQDLLDTITHTDPYKYYSDTTHEQNTTTTTDTNDNRVDKTDLSKSPSPSLSYNNDDFTNDSSFQNKQNFKDPQHSGVLIDKNFIRPLKHSNQTSAKRKPITSNNSRYKSSNPQLQNGVFRIRKRIVATCSSLTN